ncbi:MAG: acetylglutamate kinase [Chitinophagales bacterium]|nr:acetylglutamate kinase [Chitinophagales bacterium]
MAAKITIVKIGGNVIDDNQLLTTFLEKFSPIEGDKILIHGGGKIATQYAEQLGIETQMVNGRRITNDQMLDVVTMVYAGLVNKKMVAQLQALNINAIGICGADGNLIQAKKRVHPEIDFGFVGDIERVNTSLLLHLIDQSLMPVISPITHNTSGNLLNTNADTICSSIALALAKEREVSVVFCFDKLGLLKDIKDESSLIKNIQYKQIKSLVDEKIIVEGMIAKVENIAHLLENHISVVRLCHATHIDEPEMGTTFTS